MIIPFSFIGLIFGILLYGEFGFDIVFITLIALCIAMICACVYKKRFSIPFLCAIIFFILGASINFIALNSKSVFDSYAKSDVTISGMVCEIPNKTSNNYRYHIDVLLITQNEKSKPVNETIILSSPLKLEYGDVISATGTLKRINENLTQTSFNSHLYYKAYDIGYTMFCETPVKSDLKLSARNLHFYINKLRSNTINLINKHFSGDSAATLCAILTGHKGLFSEEFDDIITNTGIKRCLYPAFLHIMLITFLVSLFKSYVHKKYRIALIALLLMLYATFNSSNPIFIKSAMYVAITYMFRYKFGFIYRLDILYIVIGAILIANPLLIYNGGFVVSCASSILIFSFGEFGYDSLKFIHFKALRRSFSISLILLIGLMPLGAYYFNSVSPYQPLTIILFIPLTVAILVCSPLMLVMLKLTGFAPILYPLVNMALNIYTKLPYYINKTPLSNTILPMPSISFIVAVYLFIYAFYLYLNNRRYKIPVSLGCILSCILIVIEIISSYSMQMTFINVGQGDATLISIPYRTNILIDGGGSADYQEDYNVGEEIFVPYLQRKAKTHIDAAFVSHFHKDHAEGIIAAIENLDVDRVYLPHSLPENEYRKAIESSSKTRGTEIYYISEDTTIKLENGIVINAIVPTELALFSEDENNTTVVYKLNYGKTSCLFTGDITSIAEFGLINENKDIEADILKVPHHGSEYSTSKDFVEAVNPQYAVISTGLDNQYGFPRQKVLDNLSNTKVYRTDLNGGITFIINRNGVKKVKTMR
ncbi:MAG: DNA internalization-related competence protein ComEC/Rec2 [Clostridia bacterium]|nr:DNA internalization-related competence protein ComEC/Rec2 [Clostridia bacterium]